MQFKNNRLHNSMILRAKSGCCGPAAHYLSAQVRPKAQREKL